MPLWVLLYMESVMTAELPLPVALLALALFGWGAVVAVLPVLRGRSS